MTEEQRLIKLMQVAVENGWTGTEEALHEIDGIYLYWSNPEIRTSLNDLVLNWEEDEVSFIHALFKSIITDVEDIDEVIKSYSTLFKTVWVNMPTSQRLNYLFTTFKHLL